MSKDLPIASDEKLHTITNEILRLIEKKPDFTHFDLKETLRKSFDWNTVGEILAEHEKLKNDLKIITDQRNGLSKRVTELEKQIEKLKK